MTALMVISNIHEFDKTPLDDDDEEQPDTVKRTAGETEDDEHWRVGFYPPSLAYPYKLLKMKGIEIDFCSPEGGEVRVDPWGAELWDHPVVAKCLNSDEVSEGLKNTKMAKDINGADYDVVHFVGSHGAFFDIAVHPEIKRLVRECYEAGGYLSANNDGTAGLLGVTMSDGEYLVKGKKATSMTAIEQSLLDQKRDLPFVLEDKFKEQGCAWKWGIQVKPQVIKDGRILTGQNPNSAEPLARCLATIMKEFMKQKKLKAEEEAAR